MIEIVKNSKKAQWIIALSLVLALSVSAIAFDWFAWAMPNSETAAEVPEAENTDEIAAIEELSVPMAVPEKVITEKESYPQPDLLASLDEEKEEVPEEPETPPMPEGEENGYLTVGLYSSCSSVPNGAVASIRVSSEYGFILAKKVDRGWMPDTDLRDYMLLDVKVEDGSVNVYDVQSNLVITGLCSDDVLMSAAEEPDDRIVTIGDYNYRDGVMFRAESSSRMAVINFVELEHYLWGSINIEMTYNNPAEALKAQSVASRSYAVSHYGYHSKYGFDLCTTSNCQSYKGCRAEKEQTVQACRDTEGIVMSYKGDVACGYYFANSGGYTMNSEDVWGGKIGYLRSVQDGFADFTPWNFTVSFEYIQNKLAESGTPVGELQSVEVSAQYANGAIRTMTFTGTEGSVSLPGSKLANFLYADDSHYAKSKIYCIGNSDYPAIDFGSGSVSKKVYTIGGEISMDEFYVMTDVGPVQVSEPKGLYVTKANSIVPLFSSTETIGTTYPLLHNEVVTDGTVYVSGFGFGHGVGMSQLSAIKMAKSGKDWEDILEYFYTDIHFVNYKSLL